MKDLEVPPESALAPPLAPLRPRRPQNQRLDFVNIDEMRQAPGLLMNFVALNLLWTMRATKLVRAPA